MKPFDDKDMRTVNVLTVIQIICVIGIAVCAIGILIHLPHQPMLSTTERLPR